MTKDPYGGLVFRKHLLSFLTGLGRGSQGRRDDPYPCVTVRARGLWRDWLPGCGDGTPSPCSTPPSNVHLWHPLSPSVLDSFNRSSSLPPYYRPWCFLRFMIVMIYKGHSSLPPSSWSIYNSYLLLCTVCMRSLERVQSKILGSTLVRRRQKRRLLR